MAIRREVGPLTGAGGIGARLPRAGRAPGGDGGERVGARLFRGGPNRDVRLSQVGGSLRHRARRAAAGGRAVGCGSSRVRADRAHGEGTRPAPPTALCPASISSLPFRNKDEDAVKGQRMLAIVSVAVVLAGLPAWAQNRPAPTELAPESDRPLGDDEAMVSNFERADIREVIHSLATALGISYMLDPRIEGQVTIRTSGRISRRELFPLFSQILRQNGIAAVKTGDIYQILPVAEAKTRAIIRRGAATSDARRDDDFVIQIFQARHVRAEEMANILQPFVTPGGDVLSYPRANAVVVTDLESNVQRLRQLAATFDIDSFGNLHARVFKMREGDPGELANELLTLLAPYGVTATGEGEGGVFMVPLQRLNAIVGFAVDPAAFTEIARWLMMLDIPADKGAGRQTFVYNVENAKAADLAAVLNELFGGGEAGKVRAAEGLTGRRTGIAGGSSR